MRAFIFILFLIIQFDGYAQKSNYYDGALAYGNGFVYKVSATKRRGSEIKANINIINYANKIGQTTPRRINGEEIKPQQIVVTTQRVKKNVDKKIASCLIRGFSKRSVGQMYSFARWWGENRKAYVKAKGDVLTDDIYIGLAIYPNGKIAEVTNISFPAIPPYTEIAPQQFYLFEKEIKRRLRFRRDDNKESPQWVFANFNCLNNTKTESHLSRLAERYGRDYDYLLK